MPKVNNNFEEKLNELEALITEIEAGDGGLNESIDKYSKAQKLAEELEKMLGAAKISLSLNDEGIENTGEEKSEEEEE